LLPFGPKPSVFLSAVEKLKIRVYKTIVLPVVLYGCETWSLTLKEKRRPERGKVTGEWRELHSEEL
jgi:hypothetical protein